MLRIALASVALVLVAPVASAGPVSEAYGTAVGAVCPSPSPPGDLACHTLTYPFANVVGMADNATTTLLEFLAQDDLPVVLVDEAEQFVCHSSPNAWESVQCRQVRGRLGLPGAFDVCAESPPQPNLIGGTLYTIVNAADNATEDATSGGAFAGTPIEGEHPCHDHWQTLRAIASLP